MKIHENVNWKRGLTLLSIVYLFYFTVSIYIHEFVHVVQIWFMTGEIASVHMYDGIAINTFHTVAVTVATTPLQSDILIEIPAYLVQFGCTFLFGWVLYVKYYHSSLSAKKFP